MSRRRALQHAAQRTSVVTSDRAAISGRRSGGSVGSAGGSASSSGGRRGVVTVAWSGDGGAMNARRRLRGGMAPCSRIAMRALSCFRSGRRSQVGVYTLVIGARPCARVVERVVNVLYMLHHQNRISNDGYTYSIVLANLKLRSSLLIQVKKKLIHKKQCRLYVHATFLTRTLHLFYCVIASKREKVHKNSCSFIAA